MSRDSQRLVDYLDHILEAIERINTPLYDRPCSPYRPGKRSHAKA